jgi:hypothetical protein
MEQAEKKEATQEMLTRSRELEKDLAKFRKEDLHANFPLDGTSPSQAQMEGMYRTIFSVAAHTEYHWQD